MNATNSTAHGERPEVFRVSGPGRYVTETGEIVSVRRAPTWQFYPGLWCDGTTVWNNDGSVAAWTKRNAGKLVGRLPDVDEPRPAANACPTTPDSDPPAFRITGPGFYRRRDGRPVELDRCHDPAGYHWTDGFDFWNDSGRVACAVSEFDLLDLVERISTVSPESFQLVCPGAYWTAAGLIGQVVGVSIDRQWIGSVSLAPAFVVDCIWAPSGSILRANAPRHWWPSFSIVPFPPTPLVVPTAPTRLRPSWLHWPAAAEDLTGQPSNVGLWANAGPTTPDSAPPSTAPDTDEQKADTAEKKADQNARGDGILAQNDGKLEQNDGNSAQFDGSAEPFRITGPGRYRTRGGGEYDIFGPEPNLTYPHHVWRGVGGNESLTWRDDGSYLIQKRNYKYHLDLVARVDTPAAEPQPTDSDADTVATPAPAIAPETPTPFRVTGPGKYRVRNGATVDIVPRDVCNTIYKWKSTSPVDRMASSNTWTDDGLYHSKCPNHQWDLVELIAAAPVAAPVAALPPLVVGPGRYQMRNGAVVHVVPNELGEIYRWKTQTLYHDDGSSDGSILTWTDAGQYWRSEENHAWDLVIRLDEPPADQSSPPPPADPENPATSAGVIF